MDVESSLDAIEDALDEGDVETALRLARKVSREYPQDPDVHVALGDALWDSGDIAAARQTYQAAAGLAPQSPDVLASLAWAHFSLADFQAALPAAEQSNALGENVDACIILCRLAERAGQMDEADRHAGRAHSLAPDDFPMPFRTTEEEFRRVVSEALDALPEEFREALDGGVAILVEPVPPLEVLTSEEPPLDPELLGLYLGVPLPEREAVTAPPKLPDVIYLFQHNLEHEASDRQELLEQIAITVYHEIGHYFGFDDDELDELDFG